jgi:predicted small secreted protein
MKTKLLILTSLPVALLVAGCNKPSGPGSDYSSTNDNSLSVTQQLQNAKELATNAWQKTKTATVAAWTDIKESLGSAGDYTYDKKDEFVSKANTDMAALDQKINDWSDQAAIGTEAMKTNAQAKLKALDAKRAELGQKLEAVKNSTETNWNEAKISFKNSYEDVKNSLKNMWP